MATIKKVRCVNDTGRQDLLTSDRTYNVTKVIDNYAYVLDGVKYMHSMDRFEDVIERSKRN